MTERAVVQARVWEQIRQGRGPDPTVVAEVTAAERAVLGAHGADSAAVTIWPPCSVPAHWSRS